MNRTSLGTTALLASLYPLLADMLSQKDHEGDNVDEDDVTDPVTQARKLWSSKPNDSGWGIHWYTSSWTVPYRGGENHFTATWAIGGFHGVIKSRPHKPSGSSPTDYREINAWEQSNEDTKVFLIRVPAEWQNKMAGYFPVIRGIPSAYIRDINIRSARSGGFMKPSWSYNRQLTGSDYVSSHENYDYTTTWKEVSYTMFRPASFFGRNDGLVAFDRLSINQFRDGDYLAICCTGSALNVSATDVTMEIWDRDPGK